MPGDGRPVIAVIGAAGNTGRQAVAELMRRGAGVRATVRRAEQAGLFGDRVDCRVAELADPASLAEAVRGADATLYIPPVFSEAEERFGWHVIAALEAADCRRLVHHSVLHAATPDMPHHARKAQVELAIRHSTLEWTILQPTMYAQSALAFLGNDGRTLAPGFSLEKLFAPVALGDLAEASAVVLTDRGTRSPPTSWPGRSRRASPISRTCCVGRGRVPSTQLRSLRTRPLRQSPRSRPSKAGKILRLMLGHYDRHGLVGNAKVLPMLIGREPTSIESVFRQMKPQKA